MANTSESKRKRQESIVDKVKPAYREAKRVKLSTARNILTQTKDKALNQNGELDVASFVKARKYEIKALEDSMKASRKGLATRAFQQVPVSMRRRTASHNVKKVPKRLRKRASKEMVEDNTPAATAHSQKATHKQRVRVGKAKQTSAIMAQSKSAKAGNDQFKSTAKGRESDALATSKPSDSRFKKRQLHKSWLPTHLFHSKRAHMTTSSQPLWRFALPTTPTEKSYRTTHRASNLRGCVAWDTSYMSTIGIHGRETSLLGSLRDLNLPEAYLTGQRGEKWRAGSRSWAGWLGAESHWIAKVVIVWSPETRDSRNRKILVRVHPSAFLELWNEVHKAMKERKSLVVVEDLRFDIGSIEITGPGSIEALVGILGLPPASSDGQEGISPSQVFARLAPVTDSRSLPSGALLAFDFSDPRLKHPHRTVERSRLDTDGEDLLQLLSTWPLNNSQNISSLFDRKACLDAARRLPSQKSINRRKGNVRSGAESELPLDPQIPTLLLALNHEKERTSAGSWSLLLPWKCVLPVWYALMHYPLSSGGNPRFGGLREQCQLCFESMKPWFPGDYPGTRAGWQWELQEREKRKAEWEKRPKGKRTEWESLDLGHSARGEIGHGWACDWERLFAPRRSKDLSDSEPSHVESSADKVPPLNIRHVPSPKLVGSPDPHARSLAPVAITLLNRGLPTTCARIYRLPTSDPALRAAWLALAAPASGLRRASNRAPNARHGDWSYSRAPMEPTPASRARLAASLLEPARSAARGEPGSKAGETDHPVVPGQEDLIGFVTSGNFNLGEGKGTGVGNVALAKVWEADVGKGADLCIVREAGKAIGRLGRWRFIWED